MSLKGVIVDGEGKGTKAIVTSNGQLVTAPLSYSTPVFTRLAVNNQGYTFFEPINSDLFVITDIIADADKGVGANGATVIVYEAEDADIATVSKTIIQFEMLKNTSKILTGLNFIVSTVGRFVNAKTNDNNISMTIAGYYISS
jgi:hypothetical protein